MAGEKQESRVRKEHAWHQRIHFSMAGQTGACPWTISCQNPCVSSSHETSTLKGWRNTRRHSAEEGSRTFPGYFHVLSVRECWHAAVSLGDTAMLTLATLAGLLPTLAWDLGCLAIPMLPPACCRTADVAEQTMLCGHKNCAGTMYRGLIDLKSYMFSTLTGL